MNMSIKKVQQFKRIILSCFLVAVGLLFLKFYGIGISEQASPSIFGTLATSKPCICVSCTNTVPPEQCEQFFHANGGERTILKLCTITHIKSIEGVTHIFVENRPNDPYLTTSPKKRIHILEEKLKPFGFIRTHRAQLANMHKVCCIKKGKISMIDGSTVDISETYSPQVDDWLANSIN